MKARLIVLFSLLFSVNIVFASVYTTGIDTRVISNEIVQITWKANTNSAYFKIYRNSGKAIRSMAILSNAEDIKIIHLEGKLNGSLYEFGPVTDEPPTNGMYYYAVFVSTENLTTANLKPNINLTLFPVTIKISVKTNVMTNQIKTNEILKTNVVVVKKPEPVITNQIIKHVIKKPIVVTNVKTIVIPVKIEKKKIMRKKAVSVKIETHPVFVEPVQIQPELKYFYVLKRPDSALLKWEIKSRYNQDLVFNIYRSDKPIRSLSGLKPYVKLENELFFVDYQVKTDRPYYYAVQLQGNKKHIVFKSTKRPILFFGLHQNVKIERKFIFVKKKKSTEQLDINKEKSRLNNVEKKESSENFIKSEKSDKIIKPVKKTVKEKKLKGPLVLEGEEKILSGKTEGKINRLENEVRKKFIPKTIFYEKKNSGAISTSKTLKKTEKKKYHVVSESFIVGEGKRKETEKKKYVDLKAAKRLFQRKKYKSVISLLQNKIEPDALFLTGRSYYNLSMYKKALKVFKKLKKNRPEKARLWIKLTIKRWGESQ